MPKSPLSCSPSRASSSSAKKSHRKPARPTFRATLSSRSPRDSRLLSRFSELIASTLNLPVAQLMTTSPTAQRKTLNLSSLDSHQLDKVDELISLLLSTQPRKDSRSTRFLIDILKSSANTIKPTTRSFTMPCQDESGLCKSTGTTDPPAPENPTAQRKKLVPMYTANHLENGGTAIEVKNLLSLTNSEPTGCPSTIYFSFATSIPLTLKSKEEYESSPASDSTSPAPSDGTNYSEAKPTRCSTNSDEESLKPATSLIDLWPYEDLTK